MTLYGYGKKHKNMEPFYYIEKQKKEKKESSYCGKATKIVETYHHLIQPRPRENSSKHTSVFGKPRIYLMLHRNFMLK